MKASEVVNKLDDPSNKNIICETVSLAISNNINNSKDCLEYIAEKMAFQNTFLKEDGMFCDDHLLFNEITDYDKLFSYYEKRGLEVSHPLLIIVYLGMVFEFKKKYTRQEMNFDLKKKYILSICKYIDEGYLPYKNAEPKWVIRAIDLAIRTRNQELIDSVKHTTIRYVDKVNKGTLLAIVLDKITENYECFEREIDHIIEKAETLLKSLSETAGRNFMPTQALTKSLCKYYNSQSQKYRTKLKKTIDSFSLYCHEKLIDASSYDFRKVAELYEEYGFTDDLNREEFQIQQSQEKEFQELSCIFVYTPVMIIDHYEEQTNKSWLDNLEFILTNIVPDIKTAEEDFKSTAKNDVLSKMCSKPILSPDESGRSEGYVGGMDDLKGNTTLKLSEQLSLKYISLKRIIDLLKSKIDKEELLKYLKNSYAFSKIDSRFLKAIIDYYFENNFIVFIHIIIPQIEEAFRNILFHNGCTTHKKLEDHTETLKLLNDLLFEPIITSIFGKNTKMFFINVLIGRNFLNIRNAVCHGYFPYDSFNEQNSDLLMLIALILANKTQLKSQLPSNA